MESYSILNWCCSLKLISGGLKGILSDWNHMIKPCLLSVLLCQKVCLAFWSSWELKQLLMHVSYGAFWDRVLDLSCCPPGLLCRRVKHGALLRPLPYFSFLLTVNSTSEGASSWTGGDFQTLCRVLAVSLFNPGHIMQGLVEQPCHVGSCTASRLCNQLESQVSCAEGSV